MIHILPFLDIIARGGGGGSGGGGGGGGSGGGSLAVLLGYTPAYYATSKLYKHVSARAGMVGGIIIGLLVTVGFGFLALEVAFLVGVGAIGGVYTGLHNMIARVLTKFKSTKHIITRAASQDPVWREEALHRRISEVFYNFQKDWSQFNLDNMRTYTSPGYFDHMRLLLTVLTQLGRQNAMGNVNLLKFYIIQAMDAPNNDKDYFTVYIQASADDMLVDTKTNNILFRDTNRFEEYWLFDRSGDEWVLQGINQATENVDELQRAMRDFAGRSGMYYSLDMGWLLIPRRGQLFSSAQFGRSDINNHIIGEWGGMVVQLYTYIPHKALQRADNYLIGQIALPKSYGGIIIRRTGKLSWLRSAPRGYGKVSFEWPDFNKRYTVYATDMDKVTSFELLNPAYMARLYDAELPINIEVVDNVVYFYARLANATQKYDVMLDVLKLAYRELER